MQENQDRAVGILLGLAAGDQIGGPVRMALRVAESLSDHDGVDLANIGTRYLEWWREGAFDTGPTVAQVLSLVASGATFDEASTRVDESRRGMTAGCNPAHRIAPIAMCASLADSALAEVAVAEARLTHRNPLAGDVAAVVAQLCRALIRGSSWPSALGMAAKGRSPEVRRAVEPLHSGDLSRSGFAPDVLRSAVHFLNSSDSVSDALARAIDFAGPSNYCPVLVGSIGGARWGASRIEETKLRHHGDLMAQLKKVSLNLAAGW